MSEECDQEDTCELCGGSFARLTKEQDELGNEVWACEDCAEGLASKTPERAADVWYDQTHKSGD